MHIIYMCCIYVLRICITYLHYYIMMKIRFQNMLFKRQLYIIKQNKCRTYVYILCVLRMRITYVYCVCVLRMYITYMYCVCVLHMCIMYVCYICVLRICIAYVYYVCVLHICITYMYCICALLCYDKNLFSKYVI